MSPDEDAAFVRHLLAAYPGLCLDSRSIWNWTSLLATLTADQRHTLLPLARRQEAARQKAEGGRTRPGWTDEDWLRVAGSYSPHELLTDPPWPTEFGRVLADVRDITDPQRRPPLLVVPDEDDWIFVGAYDEVDVPLKVPIRLWVAAKEQADSNPLVEQYGTESGLAVRYFIRYENGARHVLLMRREMTVARYFTQLTRSGLEDLGRAISGRSEFRYIDAMIQHRIGLRRDARAKGAEPPEGA